MIQRRLGLPGVTGSFDAPSEGAGNPDQVACHQDPSVARNQRRNTRR